MIKSSPRLLFLLLVLLFLCYIFYYNTEYDTFKAVSILISSSHPDTIDFSKRRFEKFIFSLGSGGCVGIGNQMFRIASLYGIGLYPNVNRTPGVNGPASCVRSYMKEFSEIFPNVVKLAEFDVMLITRIYKIIVYFRI